MNPLTHLKRLRRQLALQMLGLWLKPAATANRHLDPTHYLHPPRLGEHLDAELLRQPDGTLTLRWHSGIPVTRLRVSTDPAGTALVEERELGNPGGEVSLPGLNPLHRHYLHLEAGEGSQAPRVTVAERFLPLQGAFNVRDLGGYRTEDGRALRWGRLLRSDGLGHLTDADLRYLAQNFRPHSICDFRGLQERTPSRFPEPGGPTLHHLPIEAHGSSMRHLLPILRKGGTAAMAVFGRTYVRMAEEHAATVFGPFLRHAAEAVESGPLLFHCTAGKDRTGIAAALLLGALGVPEETVVADYTLTNAVYVPLTQGLAADPDLLRIGITPDHLRPILVADPAWMRALLSHLRTRYGSVAGYLTGPAGVESAVLDRLQARLLH